MAKYDQGGGCACGLQRVCDCPSRSQSDGRKTVKLADGSFIIDRTDPEGGIPGRVTLREHTVHHFPKGRVDKANRNAARRKRYAERVAAEQARIDEQCDIWTRVQSLSPRALKVWERVKKGQWYTDPTPSIQELVDAGLVVLQGRVAVVRAAYVPVGTISLVSERIPENLP